MMIRFAIVPLLLALNFSMCKKHETASPNAQPGDNSSPAAAAATATPVVAASPRIAKPVVDQTAQTIILCYHRLVDKIHTPWTEITPAAFEAQMKELKDHGITVISLQDLLAWKRGEKNIPPRCAVITFDDGWKSQYEVAWPILKKYGYPFTMFLYTEGIAGGSLGGGQAITRDTVFRVASMIKTITSVAAMQLVEQGKLDLDADVNGYLDFKVPSSGKTYFDAMASMCFLTSAMNCFFARVFSSSLVASIIRLKFSRGNLASTGTRQSPSLITASTFSPLRKQYCVAK